MRVLGRTKVGERAIKSSRRHHGQLVAEIHHAFYDGFLVSNQTPHTLGVLDRLNAMLAFAVVPKRCGLDDGRNANAPQCNGKLVECPNRGARRGGKSRDRRGRPSHELAAA